MVHYQTVRKNYFYEQPLLYCRNFGLQKYQLQRQIERRWDLSTELSTLWEKVCGAWLEDSCINDLIKTSSLLKTVTQIQYLPNIYMKINTYLDPIKKLWIYYILYRQVVIQILYKNIIYI
jgi:hypothetical protein